MWKPLHGYGNIFKVWKWFVYENENELLLSSYKNKLEIIKSKHLGKWYNLFLLWKFDRSFEFVEDAFKNGVVFYQEMFDTDQWSFYKSFIKWQTLSKEQISYYNELLEDFGLKLQSYKKRVEIVWDFENIEQIQEKLIETNDINYVFSFLLWLSIFYGQVQSNNENIIKWVQINFNFDNMWLRIDEIIENFRKIFRENEILINVSGEWISFNISSHDWEFEKFIWENLLEDFRVGKEESSEKMKEKILNFIEQTKEIENKQDAKKIIEENDLKVVSF